MSQAKRYIMPIIRFSAFFAIVHYKKFSSGQLVVKRYETQNAKIKSLERKND